jgi:hypothetical protein
MTVVLPEFVPDSWWEHFLHGQSAQFLKVALLFRPGFVVTSVPTHVHTRGDPFARPGRSEHRHADGSVHTDGAGANGASAKE